MPDKFVFHGTPKKFDAEEAIPRRNVRLAEGDKVIFDEESFHATPQKWIALAYIYHPKQINLPSINGRYSMGVDLYSDKKEIAIFGVGTLEESLKELYGDGGYLYHFEDGNFIYKEGLGSQEVISTKPTRPLTMEKIDDPVEEMRKLGVTFDFVDLSLSENEKYRE